VKRDERLRGLGHDHHHALVLARRAAVASQGDEGEAHRVWDEVVRRFEGELAPHFAIEERLLLPALDGGRHAPLSARTRDDHRALRALVEEDRGPVAARLERFGATLRDHVRFEERVLFPALEEEAGDAALDAAAAAHQRLVEPAAELK